MLQRWSVRSKLLAGFGLCVLLVVSLGGAFYTRTQELSVNARLLVDSHESILHLKTLEMDLEHIGLDPSSMDQQLVNREMDRLLDLSESEPNQHQRLQRFREILKRRLNPPNPDEGRRLKAETQSQLELLLAEERLLLQQRQENLAYGTDNNRIGLALGTLGCALLVGGVAGLIHRDMARSVQLLVKASRQVGQGDYSFRLAVQGTDELSAVGEAFNTMADQLQVERQKLLDVQADLRSSNLSLEQRAEELLQRGQEVHQLQQLMELLQSSSSLEEAVKLLGPRLSRLLPGSRGALYFLNQSRTVLELSGSWGLEETVEPAFTAEDCWALRRAKEHVAPPEQPELRCAHWGDSQNQWHSCSPLLAHGEVLGVISLTYAEPPRDSQLLRSICEQLSLALANLRLRDSLRQQSIRDALTGLYNRRFLEESLQRELARSQRRSQPLAVVMLDVDHFKRFNDNYGHEVGDQVLQAVASYLQLAVRAEDVVCRFGGEEFCLLCPSLCEPDLSLRLEQLRQGLEAVTVSFQGERLHVTASFGASICPLHSTEGAQLLLLADQALYEAKHAGRNTFRVCQQLVKAGASGESKAE
ncbi:diguanylate cyclase [bacterium]|nr:diguanylate cyclase [bacterium]